MKASNLALAQDLDSAEKLALGREIWGHNSNVLAQKFTGDHDWYTPKKYIEAARLVSSAPVSF